MVFLGYGDVTTLAHRKRCFNRGTSWSFQLRSLEIVWAAYKLANEHATKILEIALRPSDEVLPFWVSASAEGLSLLR